MAVIKTTQIDAFSGERTVEMIKNLLRYDIPFLLLGKSSIGKSYSVIELAKEFRVPHSFLFIGSETPSNIEGLPRLVGKKAEAGDILEFFKPNWFPNAMLIQRYVTNGKKVFEDKIIPNYNGKKVGIESGKDFIGLNNLFEVITKLKWDNSTTKKESFELIDKTKATSKSIGDKLTSKPVEFIREIETEKQIIDPNKYVKDEVRDLCLYLSTILGYGNFWLILDELDKVDEREKDKYAPLLHIVRERHIKDYSFQTLNEGKGAQVPMKVKSGSDYRTVKNLIDNSIKNDLPLLDGRVIGIANATSEIEDALFRRFLHIVVEDVMMINKPEPKLSSMRACFDAINKRAEEEFGGSGLMGGLEMKFIPEINLQWQYGFFPKILNREDTLGNSFVLDLMKLFSRLSKDASNDPSRYKTQVLNVSKESALYKIIRNNFAVVGEDGQEMSPRESSALREAIMDCVTSMLGVAYNVEEDIAPEIATAGVMEETTSDLVREDVINTINTYLLSNNNDMKEVALMIGALMGTEFPKETIPSAHLVHNWADRVLSFIKVTMYDENKIFSQMEINKFLAPVLLKTLYKYTLSANIDENAKKMIIQKVSLTFGKLFIENDVKKEALDFDAEMVQKQSYDMISQVVPKLEESYMGTDIWFLLDKLSMSKNILTQENKKLYENLKENWGEQIVALAQQKIEALDKRNKIAPSKTLSNKLDRAIGIKVMFKKK